MIEKTPREELIATLTKLRLGFMVTDRGEVRLNSVASIKFADYVENVGTIYVDFVFDDNGQFQVLTINEY